MKTSHTKITTKVPSVRLSWGSTGWNTWNGNHGWGYLLETLPSKMQCSSFFICNPGKKWPARGRTLGGSLWAVWAAHASPV